MSGEAKTSTKVLFVSALVLLVVLLTGPLGYKFDLVPLEPSLISLLIALVGGALIVGEPLPGCYSPSSA